MLKYLLIGILAVSVLNFIIYGLDKRAAKKKEWRTPERRLLLFGFFCGAPGGLLGMMLFHHKTKKWYFWLVNWIGLAWQAAAVVYLAIQQSAH